MRKMLLVLSLASLPWITPSSDDDAVHEAMEAIEKHLDALAEVTLEALSNADESALPGLSETAQSALDGLAEALHPILGSKPFAPSAAEGGETLDAVALHERELLYQRSLVGLLDKTLEAELALVRGEWAGVQACVDELYAQEDEGHQAYRKKKKRAW